MAEFKVRRVSGGRGSKTSVVAFGRQEGKIMDLLWKNKVATAKDIGARLRVSLPQANVMLRRLASKGLVVREKVEQTGSRGRPSVVYGPAVSRRDFGQTLAEDLRLALLDVDERFGVSRQRERTFINSLRASRE